MKRSTRGRWALGSCVASATWLVTSVCFAGMAVGGGFGGLGMGSSWAANGLSVITENLVGLSRPVAVVALAGGGIGLLFGRDFGQLAHTASYVAIVCGVVATAGSIFGDMGAVGALLP